MSYKASIHFGGPLLLRIEEDTEIAVVLRFLTDVGELVSRRHPALLVSIVLLPTRSHCTTLVAREHGYCVAMSWRPIVLLARL